MSHLKRSDFIKRSKLPKKINLRSSGIVYHSVKVIKMLNLKGITLGGFHLIITSVQNLNKKNVKKVLTIQNDKVNV